MRYDEILSSKANKMALDEMFNYATSTYLKQTVYTREQDTVNLSLGKLLDETKSLRETLQLVSDNIQKDIHTAVRRSTVTLKQQLTNN